MAAGLGNRMRPITNTIPKPLVQVQGHRMIDTILSALHQNGIWEIYVVVGHLKEAFASLPAENPGLTLIENPDYLTCNNISSLYYAREHLEDVVILDGEGRVKEVYAAHDSGKVVNPTSIQGQIEGGVLMGLGYALTEDFPLKDCVPQAKFGTLGLMRADQIPDIHAIYVEKEELLPFAYGAKGIGEIATIPTAPAVQGAYYARDHILRTSLPMQDTFYKKPAKKAAP